MTQMTTLLTVEPTPNASIRIATPPRLLAGREIPTRVTLTDGRGDVTVERVKLTIEVPHDGGRRVIAAPSIASRLQVESGMSAATTAAFELPADTPPTVAGIDAVASVTADTTHGSVREQVFLTVGLPDAFRAAFESAVETGLSLRNVACRTTNDSGQLVSEYSFDASELAALPSRVKLFFSTSSDGLAVAAVAGQRDGLPDSWHRVEAGAVSESVRGVLGTVG